MSDFDLNRFKAYKIKINEWHKSKTNKKKEHKKEQKINKNQKKNEKEKEIKFNRGPINVINK